MVDLHGQHMKIKKEVDNVIQETIYNSVFINGPSVKEFQKNLEYFLNLNHVIPCGNGTDALQIALMALNIEKGAEILVPTFSFAAPAEVVALLGYTPVFVDVEPDTFNMCPVSLERAITKRSRAIIPVHLFGQCANMEQIMKLAQNHNLYIIEDNAQSIGAVYHFSSGKSALAGTMGDVGITSFFPSKNLGCMGDGGALFTNNTDIAYKASLIANHGQKIKYEHEVVGINSRLDTIQAAILNLKLKYLLSYNHARTEVAEFYHQHFKDMEGVQTPVSNPKSTHVYNQYTLAVNKGVRNTLINALKSVGIPTMIYYPKPLHLQNAFKYLTYQKGDFPVSESLASCVLSLPIHTEMDFTQLEYIASNVCKALESCHVKNSVL